MTMTGLKFQQGDHYNYGKGGCGYGGNCTTEPRLYGISRRSGWHFYVDGMECPREEIEARLAVPAVATDEERAFLSTLADEPFDIRGNDIHLMHFLKRKAFIEYTGTPRWFKRTEAGKAVAT